MVPAGGANVELSGYQSTVPYGYGLDGFIGEFVWYDHALSEAERAQVERYLMTKWGLSALTAQELPGPPQSGPLPPHLEGVAGQ